MHMKYPWKTKRFYPVHWPGQAVSVELGRVVLPMGRGHPSLVCKQWKKSISFSKCLFPERMSHVASTTEALKCLAGLPLSPSLTEQIE